MTQITATATVDCFVESFATNLSAAKNAQGDLVFSWTKISGQSMNYSVEVSTIDHTRVWNAYNLGDVASVTYTAPAFTTGVTYKYDVVAGPSDGKQCRSFAQKEFIY